MKWGSVSSADHVEPEEKPIRGLKFNEDVKWQNFVYKKYKTLCSRIAFKYCMSDPDLREDAEQEGMIALMTVFPEEVNGWDEYASGALTEKQWIAKLDVYLRNVIRNSILAMLASDKAGNWYVGRKKLRKNPVTGEKEYVPTPSRYVQLDTLVNGAPTRKIQIGTDGVIYIPGDASVEIDRLYRQEDMHG